MLGYYSYKQWKRKIFGFKNVMEGRIRKILIFVIQVKLNFKFSWNFRENNTEAIAIVTSVEKTQVPLGWPNRYQLYSDS